MMLGKRPRPPMKRTTSLSEITFDLTCEAPSSDLQNPFNNHQALDGLMVKMAVPSPRNHRRKSADFLETPHFLKACGLCKRGLVPSHDVYMYRGDTAFCSLECREQQITLDEKKEKCSSSTSNKSPSLGQRRTT